jgi:predicted Zn finger-like uncharacterized protein
MILTCPACATRYLTDPALLGAAGRVVRCAKCGHSWMQVPPADMPRRVDVPIPPRMETADSRAQLPARVTEKPRRVAGGFAFGLLALIAVVLGIASGSAYLWREWIVAELPQAKQLYDLIGIRAVPLGAGLEFSNLKFERRQIDGADSIIIEGELFNTTPEPQSIPTLKATLQDEGGRWLSDWTFSLGRPALESGETVTFKVTKRDPPAATRKLSVAFTEEPPES